MIFGKLFSQKHVIKRFQVLFKIPEHDNVSIDSLTFSLLRVISGGKVLQFAYNTYTDISGTVLAQKQLVKYIWFIVIQSFKWIILSWHVEFLDAQITLMQISQFNVLVAISKYVKVMRWVCYYF